MKEILIPLNFTTTPTVYDTKQSFSTSDEASGVLIFTTTADVAGTVASLTIRNASENAKRQTVLVERLDVNSSPFSYTLKNPLPFGQYEGTILLKKNLTVIASATFLFGVNSSLSAEVLPDLVRAYSLDELFENVETEVSNLKDAYNLTVSETVKGVNKTESSLQAQENVRYLNEHARKANELERISNEQARVAAELARKETFDTLVDSEVIEQTVVQEVAEKYQEIEALNAPEMVSFRQQLAEIEADYQAAVGAVTADSEVVLARGGETTLGQRLDKTEQELNAQLAEKAPLSEVVDIRTSQDGVVFDSSKNRIDVIQLHSKMKRNRIFPKWVYGNFLNTTGVKTGNAAIVGLNITTDKMYLPKGSVVLLNTSDGLMTFKIAYYDQAGAFLRYTPFSNTVKQIIANEDMYINIVLQYSNPTNMPVTEGNAYVTIFNYANDALTGQAYNLIKSEDILDFYYVNSATGAYVYGDLFLSTGFIAVTPLKTYKAKNGYAGAFYDANKTFISGFDLTSVPTKEFTVPTGCAYVNFTLKYTDNATLPFDKSKYYLSEVDYFEKITIDNLSVGTENIRKKTITSDLIADGVLEGSAGALNGLKWVSLGDSNTQNGLWQPYITDYFNMTFTNLGIGGTSIANTGDRSDYMCSAGRVGAIPTDTDLVVIMGGTNDWIKCVPLGTASITNIDITTFYGALNEMFRRLSARLTFKRIVATAPIFGYRVDIPAQIDGTNGLVNTQGLTTQDYGDAIQKACGWWGATFIDTRQIGINRENRGAFLIKEPSITPDCYIHFTAAGAKRFAEKVISDLNNVVVL